jgi:hypothetical protein
MTLLLHVHDLVVGSQTGVQECRIISTDRDRKPQQRRYEPFLPAGLFSARERRALLPSSPLGCGPTCWARAPSRELAWETRPAPIQDPDRGRA